MAASDNVIPTSADPASTTTPAASAAMHSTTSLPPDIDCGNLLVSQVGILDAKHMADDPDAYMMSITRDNVQLLVNTLSQLPSEVVDDVVVAKLPEGKTEIPRAKPPPKPKPPTKWEQYAKAKGIHTQKQSKMEWDETAQEWRRRYGYQKANDPADQWLIEVPNNADPYEDQFEKIAKDKKEQVAKNEFQRLRNISRASKAPVRTFGSGSERKKKAPDDLRDQAAYARESTASAGKFQKALPKDVPQPSGRKRKFESNFSAGPSESERALAAVKRVLNKQPKLDVEKAVNRSLHDDQLQRASEKKTKPVKQMRRSKAGDRSGRTRKHGFSGSAEGSGDFTGGRGGQMRGRGRGRGVGKPFRSSGGHRGGFSRGGRGGSDRGGRGGNRYGGFGGNSRGAGRGMRSGGSRGRSRGMRRGSR